MIEGASLAIHPSKTPDEIAKTLLYLSANPSILAEMRTVAFERRREALWGTAVTRMRQSLLLSEQWAAVEPAQIPPYKAAREC